MAEAVGRGDMLHPRAVLRLVPGQRRLRVAELRQHLARFAVVVEVGEDRELDREAAVDLGFGPRRPGPTRLGRARVAIPGDALGEPADRDEVGAAVAVDVEREIAEGVDVVAREGNFTKAVRCPRRRLIPEIAGDDVQTAIAVHVEDRGRLAGAVVDLMDDERDVRRSARAEADERDERQQADRRRMRGEVAGLTERRDLGALAGAVQQQRVQHALQVLREERLVERLEAVAVADGGFLGVERHAAHHHHRQPREALAQLHREVDAVAVRQHDVDHRGVGPDLLDRLRRVLQRGEHHRLEAGGLQFLLQPGEQALVVVDDHDDRLGRHRIAAAFARRDGQALGCLRPTSPRPARPARRRLWRRAPPAAG